MGLLARFVDFPAFAVTDIPFNPGEIEVWQQSAPGMDYYVFAFTTSKFPGRPNFPYGYDVEPD